MRKMDSVFIGYFHQWTLKKHTTDAPTALAESNNFFECKILLLLNVIAKFHVRHIGT